MRVMDSGHVNERIKNRPQFSPGCQEQADNGSKATKARPHDRDVYRSVYNRKQKAGSLLLLRACPGGCPSCGWSLMRWRSGR